MLPKKDEFQPALEDPLVTWQACVQAERVRLSGCSDDRLRLTGALIIWQGVGTTSCAWDVCGCVGVGVFSPGEGRSAQQLATNIVEGGKVRSITRYAAYTMFDNFGLPPIWLHTFLRTNTLRAASLSFKGICIIYITYII